MKIIKLESSEELTRLKQINGYWVDENNNRWNIEIYTEEEAEKCSKSLVNCHDCYNCVDCKYCRNCNDCRYCINCRYCNSCLACYHCKNCRNCNDCRSCRYCVDCRSCDYCKNCNYCNNCRNCNDCGNCDNCRYCETCNYCDRCDNCSCCDNYVNYSNQNDCENSSNHEKLEKLYSKQSVNESATNAHRESFRLNGVAFSVIFDGDSVRMRSYRPYDDAEYHYAISKDGGEQFSIYRDRKFVEQFAPFSFDEDEESGIRNFNWNEVARELLRLDKDVESRMMHD